MKKLFLGMAAIAMMAVACKKDDDTNRGGGPDPVVPVSLISKVYTENDTVRYTYNKDFTLSTVGYGDDTDYSLDSIVYANGKPVKVMTTTAKGGTFVLTREFVYDGKNLVRVKYANGAGAIVPEKYDSLVYDVMGKPTKYYKHNNGYAFRSGEFTWDTKGNVTSEKSYGAENQLPSYYGIESYTYDDKFSRPTLYWILFFMGDQLSPSPISFNNMTSQSVERDSDKKVTEKYTHEFKYNAMGLVIEDKYTEEDFLSNTKEETVLKYEYIEMKPE
jgi:hypothetical protein